MPGNEVASATLRPINKQKKQMCSIVDEFPQASGELIVLFHVQPVKGRKLVKLHPNFMWERDPRGVPADFPYHCIHNRGTAHGTARGSRHGVGIHHMYLAHGEWTDLQNLKHGMPQKPIGFRPHFGIDTAVVRCFSVFSICGPINIIYKYIYICNYIYMIIYVPWSLTMAIGNHACEKSPTNGYKWITKIRMTATWAPQYSLLL